MGFEPPIVCDAVVDERHEQRMSKSGQLIAEPASRLRRRAIGRRLDRQPNQLAGREVDRLPAIDYEPVGKHLHEHDGSARASPLGQSGETPAIRRRQRRECAETSYTISR